MLLPFHAEDATPPLDPSLRQRGLVTVIRQLLKLGYFGLEVEGQEHLPGDERVIYAPNHAGWFALDAFFVGLAVSDALGPERAPVFAAHDAAVAAPILGPFLRRAGAVPASWLRRPEKLPPEVRSIGIFPEGVPGNTKPFWQAYRMREWKRGLVRFAAAVDAPIVPTAVLGGEECLPVALTVKRLAPLIGSELGLPLAPLPLPTRWKVVFHPPVRVDREILHDPAAQTALAARIRATVQETLDRHAWEKPLGKLSSIVGMAERIGAHRAERAEERRRRALPAPA